VNFIANQRQLSQMENDGLNFAAEIMKQAPQSIEMHC